MPCDTLITWFRPGADNCGEKCTASAGKPSWNLYCAGISAALDYVQEHATIIASHHLRAADGRSERNQIVTMLS